jgi:hypothetical protein
LVLVGLVVLVERVGRGQQVAPDLAAPIQSLVHSAQQGLHISTVLVVQ